MTQSASPEVLLEHAASLRELARSLVRTDDDADDLVQNTWLRALQARATAKDPPTLQVELDAHESLAASRNQLLDVIINYNISLVELEKTKGTLLRYNNIILRGEEDQYYPNPYRAMIQEGAEDAPGDDF